MKATIFKVIKIVEIEKGYKEKDFPTFVDASRYYEIGTIRQFVLDDEEGYVKGIVNAKAITHVEDNHITGNLSNVIETLNRCIGQYKRNYKHLKIGITGRLPKERYKEHLSECSWKRMIVLYKTSSIDIAKKIETNLIDFHREDLANKIGGGGGKLAEKGFNYLYIILR